MNISKRFSNGDKVFLMAFLVASLCLNVFLGWKVQRLGNTLAAIPNPNELLIGTFLSSVTVSNLNNHQETITLAGTGVPTVLYVFSPTCVWCDRNIKNIKTLADLKKDSFHFVGLSLADGNLDKYVNKHEFNFPVYKKLQMENINTLKLGSTPQTIVISPEGKVLKSWTGAYGARLKGEIETFFGAQLPGTTVQEESAGGTTAVSSCDYCLLDGLLYSLGSVTKIGDTRMRCTEDRQWHYL